MKKIFAILLAGLLCIPTLSGVSLAAETEGGEPMNSVTHVGTFDGHTYCLYDVGKTYFEAEEACESYGGYLATITSEEEQVFIESLLVEGTKNSYWIGALQERGTESPWRWITGEKFSYTHWAPGMPDNCKYSSSDGEDNLMIYRNQNPRVSCKLGDWNDLYWDGTCGNESFFGLENFGFICEWEAEMADEEIPADPPEEQTVPDISKATVELISEVDYTGTEITPEPVVKLFGVRLVKGKNYELTYKNNVSPGTASVILTGIAQCAGSRTETFTIRPLGDLSEATISAASEAAYTGQPIALEDVTIELNGVVLTEGTDYAVTYENNVGAGTATMTVQGIGGYIGAKAHTFEIIDVCTDGESHDWQQKIKKATTTEYGGVYMRCQKCGREDLSVPLAAVDKFTLSATSYTYDGTAKKPSVKVENGFGDVLSTDEYKVTYTNNTNAGTAMAKVTLTSDYYEGTKKLTFQIKPVALSKATAASIKAQTYTGKAQQPAVRLTFGGKTLKSGTDYTVTYKSNKAVGTATIIVIGKGNFAGMKKLTFQINKAANPITVKGRTATVKYSAVKKKAQTITAKQAFTVSKAQGKVTYKKSSGSKSITVSSAGKITVKKGTKKGTYQIKVKVTAAGNGNYKATVKTVTVVVKVK